MKLKSIFDGVGIYSLISRVMFLPLIVLSLIFGCMAFSSFGNRGKEYREGQYTVREYNGRIAVFSDDNAAPIEILDVFVKTLPSSDVCKLRDGIKAEGKDEVISLIEDFSG